MTERERAQDAEPVAWANWKVDSASYVPYRTKALAEESVRNSAISATQEGPYMVVPLYAAPPPDARDETIRKLRTCLEDALAKARAALKYAS